MLYAVPFDDDTRLRVMWLMPKRVRCPICHTECAWENNPSRPFCSERCRLVDLGNWLGERYRIAGAPAADESDNPPDAGADDERRSAPPRAGK